MTSRPSTGARRGLVARRGVCAGLAGLIVWVAFALLAPAANAATMLVIQEPNPGATTGHLPKFAGESTDMLDPVKVAVYQGSTASGSPLQTLETQPSALTGEWSIKESESLGGGTYTAQAEQDELLSGESVSSEAVTFTVDASPPEVTIGQPPTPSKDRTPSFAGKASEDTEVVVHVELGGAEVAEATTKAAGGSWSTPPLTTELATGKHTYTAYATEKSGLGNESGESKPVSFVVDTESPTVTIAQPPTPTGNTTPSFSGTASENTEVVVHVKEGASEVAKATTTAAGGSWSTSTLSTALAKGRHSYTAYATEKSSLGNPDGKSGEVAFEVNTEAPKLSIAGPGRSNDTTPSFSGTTSEDGEVIVHIFEGSKQVATASAESSGGNWSATSPALKSGDHSFTAYATEVSPVSGAEGKSATVEFEVDTEVPVVTIVGPPSPSKNTTPSFSGTASEETEVTVHVFEGPTEVAKQSTAAAGGKWSITLSNPLVKGRHSFTADATEKSGLGNGEGTSAKVGPFEVDTEPPTVTIVGPAALSNDTTPTFSGTASENTEVTVHVFEGPTEVGKQSTTAVAGKWSITLSNPLVKGRHSFTADATEESGLGNPDGESGKVDFEVDTETPTVTIVGPPSPSNDTTPSFSGTASEATEVTVHVFEGSTEVGKQSTTAAGGKWSLTLSNPLANGKHSFTADATEKSGLGNGEGQSETVPFVVNTNVPVVTIVGPPSPSKNTTPSFSGTASEETEVTVHVFEGPTEVAKQTTVASAGKWSLTLSKALETGKHSFTADATEKSGLGNGEGTSATVGPFEVDTEPPTVTIVGPPTPSNDTTPSFSGTASEDTEVTVHVFEGSTEVGKQSTTASGGKWSVTLSKALSTGKRSFTADATEKSGLGDPDGESGKVTFEVDTEPPTVVIQSGPAALSNDTTPSFSGTASEATEVTVHVFEASTEVGKQSTTAAGGKWSLTLSKALASGKHSFTAYATERSGLGNAEGQSEAVAFVVNTNVPVVTIVGPPSRSKNTSPSFSGTASEETEVTVHVFEGSTEVAKASTMASGGKWSTSTLSKALPTGKHSFTADATEKSGLGNGEGTSATVGPFEVDTEPPTVTIVAPPAKSNKLEPSFSGAASEETEVVVHIFEGATEVARASTKASGGAWTTAPLGKPLPERVKLTAYATEKSGLENGEGQSSNVSFEVNAEPPSVTIVGPPAKSNDTTPSFSGTASEATEVTVHVFEGSTEVGKQSTMASGGKWSLTLSNPLAKGKHSFTADATEKSGFGNAEGQSETVGFAVNTEVPVVTIVGPPSRSKNTTPSFSGTASEETEVTVHVFEGSTEVAKASTTASGGKWSTSTLSKALSTGKHSFSADATEKSGVGNGEGESGKVPFEVDTEPPTVVIQVAPAPLSNDTTPTFSGTASEDTEVVVHVFEGSVEVGKQPTTAAGGKWSITLNNALAKGKHSFTADATEKSGLGNAEGTSATVGPFEVDTEPPTVTIVGPPARSNNTTPSFSGTASEETEVVVHVFSGATEVAKASTKASGGEWSTSTLSKALPEGKLTAYATEKSGLGNGEGTSPPVGFEVDAKPPSVTIVGPPTPSNDTTPSFSGTAGEETEVTVHVFEGSTEVGKQSTTAAGGKWSATLSTALAKGKHSFTAYATEQSGLGNAEGKSSTVSFEVNTEPPVVTIAQPKTPSKNTSPVFSGSASEATEVTVHVFEGSTEVDSGSTTASGGNWSASLSKALPTGKHSYKAYATEKSGIGNADGQSSSVPFEVNTEPPVVTIIGPKTPSKNTSPSFSGTASEATEVTVHVFEGSTEVDSGSTTAVGGSWSASLREALPSGKHSYTAYATEKSGLGNADGKSSPVPFEVNTEPPVVTLAQPKTPSNNTTPSFSGTASEDTEVVVHVFEGTTELTRASTIASGGTWTTSSISKLPSGKHTFTAYATERSGLEDGEGQSSTKSFEVNTEPPVLTIAQPKTPSNNTTPSFSGTASEATEVTVHVFEGSTEVASGSTTASGGNWAASLRGALPSGKHAFTAYATETSGLGNSPGTSSTVKFEVNTEPPIVTIGTPKTPSNITTPSFSGTASEATEVTVHVFEGSTEVASGSTTASGGNWSASLKAALPSGKHAFTAYATETSGLGNSPGTSSTVKFEVNTEPPVPTIVAPTSPSNVTTPSFSGTASEATEVTVHVFEGSTELAKASTTASGGKWSTSTLSKALPTGKHSFTAYATELSGLGNSPGKSSPVTFEVNTEAPVVTIVTPKTPTNITNPSFSGTASEATEVTVHVLEGTTEVASGSTTASGGSWTASLKAALPSGKHLFTAYATEKSGLGNAEGKSSSTGAFEVNTEPPVVTVVAPKTPSNVTTPAFTGTASEATEVTVHVLEGSSEVASESTTAASGKWSTSTLNKALPSGKHLFSAYATEKSGLGNSEGKSSPPVTFEVNTNPPEVTLEGLASPSPEQTPSFSGSASEAGSVTVEVFEGATASGKVISKIVAPVAAGRYKSSPIVNSLKTGTYSAVASEPSSLGNETGRSKPVTWEVDTEVPLVKINPLESPTKNTKPSFSGTVAGLVEGNVTVNVHEGTSKEGRTIASLQATLDNGKWATGPVTPELPGGRHTFTVVASAHNSNGTGNSAETPLVINTEPPTVTLEAPRTPSNEAEMTFRGTATETTPIEVKVYAGPSASGNTVASVSASAGGGAWEARLDKPLEEGEYTAQATQKSGIGNGPGVSAAVSFEIVTKPPQVTLAGLPSPSSDRKPDFSGTASETMPVTVKLYEGSSTNGKLVLEVEGEVSGGEWNTGPLPEPLPFGEYTAVASERSSLGNETGLSPAMTFTVADIPPGVTTEGSEDINRTYATLHGAVDPIGGSISSCNIEIGTTTAYGRAIGCGFVSGALTFPAEATGFVPVFIRVYMLKPGTLYHYRVIATGEGGTSAGADKTFTTLPPIPVPETPHASTGLGEDEVKAFFAEELGPHGSGARIKALLKKGYYEQVMKGPEAGTASVGWYYQPPTPKHHKKAKAVLVATGQVTFTAAGSKTLKIRLTKAGRALLKHSQRLKVSVRCSFQAAGGSPVTSSGTFLLKR